MTHDLAVLVKCGNQVSNSYTPNNSLFLLSNKKPRKSSWQNLSVDWKFQASLTRPTDDSIVRFLSTIYSSATKIFVPTVWNRPGVHNRKVLVMGKIWFKSRTRKQHRYWGKHSINQTSGPSHCRLQNCTIIPYKINSPFPLENARWCYITYAGYLCNIKSPLLLCLYSSKEMWFIHFNRVQWLQKYSILAMSRIESSLLARNKNKRRYLLTMCWLLMSGSSDLPQSSVLDGIQYSICVIKFSKAITKYLR